MFDSAFFNPGRPLARCAIRFLYCFALVMIALILVRGVIGGVRAMAGPPPAASGAMMPGGPPPGAPAAEPGAGPRAMMPPGMARPGMRGPGFMRPGMRRGLLGPGPLMRRLPPPVLGVILILFALLRAAVMWAVVRVLAEIALTILDLRKAFPAASN
jgi:hypothetical protein